MNSFFAAAFPDRSAAEEARRALEELDDNQVLNLVSSVVVTKDKDGRIAQYGGKTPGALGAGLGGVAGGLLGSLAGPFGMLAGAAGGAISGGWFDLMRVEERDQFLSEVAGQISAGKFALLAEVIDPSTEAKAAVEARVHEMGGSIVLKDG
jgi:uncharacterized membrane protein